MGFRANVRFLPELTGPSTTCCHRSRYAPERHHRPRRNRPPGRGSQCGELQALLAEARWEVRRQHAAEAVRRLIIRRHGVAVVVQRLVGDDVTDVEFVDLVDELTVA